MDKSDFKQNIFFVNKFYIIKNSFMPYYKD